MVRGQGGAIRTAKLGDGDGVDVGVGGGGLGARGHVETPQAVGPERAVQRDVLMAQQRLTERPVPQKVHVLLQFDGALGHLAQRRRHLGWKVAVHHRAELGLGQVLQPVARRLLDELVKVYGLVYIF